MRVRLISVVKFSFTLASSRLNRATTKTVIRTSYVLVIRMYLSTVYSSSWKGVSPDYAVVVVTNGPAGDNMMRNAGARSSGAFQSSRQSLVLLMKLTI